MKKIIYFLTLMVVPNKILSVCPCSMKNLLPLNDIELRIQKRIYPSWSLMAQNEIPFFKKEIIASPETLSNFVKICATIAETIEHHPDIIITGSSMSISLHTHSQKTVTQNDLRFIKEYEAKQNNKNTIIFPTPKPQASNNTSSQKTKKTWLNNELKKTVSFIIESTNFELIAHNIIKILKNKNYAKECISIEFSYGSCIITLQNKETKSIATSTQEYSNLIETFFKNL